MSLRATEYFQKQRFQRGSHIGILLSLKGELQMADDPVNNFVIFDKGDDFHLCAVLRAEETINFIEFCFSIDKNDCP